MTASGDIDWKGAWIQPRHSRGRFDFLGYTFRRSKNRWGKLFVNFTPAVSTDAMTKMRQEMRRWRLPLRSDKAIDDLAPSIPRAVVKGLDSTMDCVQENPVLPGIVDAFVYSCRARGYGIATFSSSCSSS